MRRDNDPVYVTGLLDLLDTLPTGLTMAEIGVFAGEATRLFVGSGKVARLYAIDPWAGDYVEDTPWTCPFPWPDVRATFLAWSDTQPNVKVFQMPSLDAAVCFAPHSLDFAYIDANHEYTHVAADLMAWLPKVKPDGYIGGHDYSPVYPGVIRAVFEMCGAHAPNGPVQVFRDTSWLCRVADLYHALV